MIISLLILIFSALPLLAEEKIDMGPYMESLQNKIKDNWQPPKSDSSRASVVEFTLGEFGTVSDLKVKKASGHYDLDISCMNAVLAAAPFDKPPVPANIEFTCDYAMLERSKIAPKYCLQAMPKKGAKDWYQKKIELSPQKNQDKENKYKVIEELEAVKI